MKRQLPTLYSQGEITALIAATRSLRTGLRQATFAILIGLLAVTGMRIGEAIALDRSDVDLEHGLLLIRHGKFDKPENSPCIRARSRRWPIFFGEGGDIATNRRDEQGLSPPPAKRSSSATNPYRNNATYRCDSHTWVQFVSPQRLASHGLQDHLP